MSPDEEITIRQWICSTERDLEGRLVVVFPDGFKRVLTAKEEADAQCMKFRIRGGSQVRISEEGGHYER